MTRYLISFPSGAMARPLEGGPLLSSACLLDVADPALRPGGCRHAFPESRMKDSLDELVRYERAQADLDAL
jgi:hypothetical protein